MDDDAFLKFDSADAAKRSNEQRIEFQKVIDDADAFAPNSDFVASCQDWLDSKGFLTPRQVDALKNLRRSYHSFDDDADRDDDGWDDENDSLDEF